MTLEKQNKTNKQINNKTPHTNKGHSKVTEKGAISLRSLSRRPKSISKGQLACGCCKNHFAQKHKGPLPSSGKTKTKRNKLSWSDQQKMLCEDHLQGNHQEKVLQTVLVTMPLPLKAVLFSHMQINLPSAVIDSQVDSVTGCLGVQERT